VIKLHFIKISCQVYTSAYESQIGWLGTRSNNIEIINLSIAKIMGKKRTTGKKYKIIENIQIRNVKLHSSNIRCALTERRFSIRLAFISFSMQGWVFHWLFPFNLIMYAHKYFNARSRGKELIVY